MNYDPTHDRPNIKAAADSTTEENTTQHNEEANPQGSENEIKAIEDSEQGASSPKISKAEVNGDLDAEQDNEQDAMEANSSEVEDDGGSKNKSNKKTNKGKKNGATSKVFRGIRHLKKADGEPFWRRDIQYDFLKEVFDNNVKAFTNYFPKEEVPEQYAGHKLTFSELYVRTLSESEKCSKVLKERLLKDDEMGKSVGKVCLLVNLGRMNTTVNFVPEMRSTLRTYHSIPSLQADPIHGGSKPLQDTPRLKSIMKAVPNIHPEIDSLEALNSNPPQVKPNLDVFLLLFLLSGQSKNAIPIHKNLCSETEDNNIDFFMNPRVHPRTRAQRFLWLAYAYLETSFSEEELKASPFHSSGDQAIDIIPEDKVDEFDRDTDYEIQFSEKMYKTRQKYISEEDGNNPRRGTRTRKGKEHEEAEEITDNSDLVTHENRESPEKRQLAAEELKRKKTKKNSPVSEVGLSQINSQEEIVGEGFAQPHVLETETMKGEPSIQNMEAGPLPSHHLDFEIPEKEFDERSMRTADYIRFPIKNLDSILKRYKASLKSPQKNNTHHLSALQNILWKSKPIIRHVRDSVNTEDNEYKAKTDLLASWIFKFFQYKKSSSNGILGMEWENIRQDIFEGMESLIYQQMGRVYLSLQQEFQNANLTSSRNIFDVAFNEIGIEGFPIHDYNRINEYNLFVLELFSFCRETFLENPEEDIKETTDPAKHEEPSIKFDLETDEIKYVN